MATLLIAEHHGIISAGVEHLLQQAGHETTVIDAPEDLMSAVERHVPDVLILDEEFPGAGKTDVSVLKNRFPSLRVIVLIRGPEHLVFGEADGIILRDTSGDQLVACLSSVCAGHRWADPILLTWLVQARVIHPTGGRLTARELQITRLIGRGLRNKEIARQLKVSEATVKMHLHHIYEKLHLSGRTELALRARDLRDAVENGGEL